jgi:archaellum component FlaC
MWERIYNFGRMLFNLSEDLKANRDNTERLEQEVRDLTTVVRQLAFELQRTRENQIHELEKMELRLKLELLQSAKQLSPKTRETEE